MKEHTVHFFGENMITEDEKNFKTTLRNVRKVRNVRNISQCFFVY